MKNRKNETAIEKDKEWERERERANQRKKE